MAEAKVIIDGVEKLITCVGGSNHSEADALADGMRRLESVKQRIGGINTQKGSDYEGDIREEPLNYLDSRNIITRNRYGAEVLNTTSCMFIDIDEPILRIWQIFKRLRTRGQKKKAILKFLDSRLKKADLKGYGIRIYETHSGIRVILDGEAMDPRSKDTRKLLKSFNADSLYVTLCGKQNCYRARLTPKPHRIKMSTIRLRYPYEVSDLELIKTWTIEYEKKSRNYASCRLINVLGSATTSLTVQYHDERTRAHSNLPLA